MKYFKAENRLDQVGVFFYISASCSPKMYRRIQDLRRSKPLFRALRMVTQMKRSHRPFAAPQPVEGPLGQRDVVFLETIRFPTGQNVWRDPDKKIPQLRAIAKDYFRRPVGFPLPHIYTSETCHEFQRFFRRALLVFKKSLINMREFRNRQPEQNEMAKFRRIIFTTTTSGLILRAIVYTSFFKDHLERLDLPYPPLQDVKDGDDKDGQGGQGGDDDDDDDEDVPGVEVGGDGDGDIDGYGNGDHDGDGGGDGDTGNKNENEGTDDTDDNDNDNEIELDDIDLLPAGQYGLACTEYAKWSWWIVAHFDAANNLLESLFNKKSEISVWIVGAKLQPAIVCSWDEASKRIRTVVGDSILDGVMTKMKQIMKVKAGQFIVTGTQHCEATLAAIITDRNLPVSVISMIFAVEPDILQC